MVRVSCAAILAVRNEELHIENTLRDLTGQGIDVVVIDNGSDDRTREISESFQGKGVIQIADVPWYGKFDWSTLLYTKQRIVNNLSHDWVIHHDADEWLQSPVEGETLLNGISRLASEGYNVINFDEFVFLPEPGHDYTSHDYRKTMLNYYFFEPVPFRLMRAWKNDGTLKGFQNGGHAVRGVAACVSLAPQAFILRHYITLSQEHVIQKYADRIYSDADLEKGWHGNRINLDATSLELPERGALKSLTHWQSRNFDRRNKKSKHFWMWRTR